MHTLRRVIYMTIAVLFLTSNCNNAVAASGPVTLLVFAGQSNMRGHVSKVNVDVSGPLLIPSPYKEAFAQPAPWAMQWNSGQLRPTVDDAATGQFGNRFVPFRAGYDPKTGKVAPWGPEVAFLYSRHQVTSEPVYFVKYAIGGTAVYAAYATYNWNAATTGTYSLINALAARTRAAADNLLAQGYSSVNIRLLWDQGESDTGNFGLTYRQNFDAAFQDFAAQLAGPNVTVQLATMTLVYNVSSRNAEAQITMAATDNNAQVVNAHDYPAALYISDNIHLGPDGQIRHGTEMELLDRTMPRTVIDHTATDVTAIKVKIPIKLTTIVTLSPVADGSLGWEISGQTAGLAVDPLLGRLRVTDLAQIAPGVRTLTVTRHSAPDVRLSTLVITFVR